MTSALTNINDTNQAINNRESERITAETNRQNNYQTFITNIEQNEESRKEAERLRVQADASRQNEYSRVLGEVQTNETNRENTFATRDTEFVQRRNNFDTMIATLRDNEQSRTITYETLIGRIQLAEDSRASSELQRDAAERGRVAAEQARVDRYNDLLVGVVPLATYAEAGTIIIGDGFVYEQGRLSVAGFGDLETQTHAAATYVSNSTLDAQLAIVNTSMGTYVNKSNVDGTTIKFDNDSNKLSINSDMTWNQLAQLGGVQ